MSEIELEAKCKTSSPDVVGSSTKYQLNFERILLSVDESVFVRLHASPEHEDGEDDRDDTQKKSDDQDGGGATHAAGETT
jgi:hypothetical protein